MSLYAKALQVLGLGNSINGVHLAQSETEAAEWGVVLQERTTLPAGHTPVALQLDALGSQEKIGPPKEA